MECVPVTGVTHRRGHGGGLHVTGVDTPHGHIQAEVVVNCTGMWARQLGARSGVNIPLQAAEHYYLVTEKMPGVTGVGHTWPVLEDPASHGYFREEGGGLMIGLFEPICAPWKVGGIPEDFSFGTLNPDWDRMGPYVEKAMSRVPATMEAGVRLFFCGPESFTPDLQPVVGEAPEIRNYFVAAGLNSIGILTGGGLGRVLAHWILNGQADVDVTGFNIDRLHTYQANPEYRRLRTVESLGMVYQCHYPTRSLMTARGAKRSPVHDRLAARGAYFRDVSGWEGADWYAGPGNRPESELTWKRPSWFPHWAAEHRACREGVIVMDMSFMAKFLVQGREAGKVLDHLAANSVDGPAGMITYTQFLNEGGTLEADLTISKLGDERFWVVASDTAHRHVETWIRRGIERADARASITDVTSGHAQLNVQGPRSRELLQSLTGTDLGNEAFPFRTAREIDLGFARVLCVRITYLGELGYELYIPAEQAAHVYDRIVEVGEPLGLRHAGLKALASLRMEKGYRDYGHDIDNTDSPLEAGLAFAVDLKKESGFLGKEAFLARKARGPLQRRLLQILVKDPEPLMFHAEIVRRDGKEVGYIRAASYGHTLGGAVGLAMIDGGTGRALAEWQSWIDEGRWEVDIAGTRYPAVASHRPLYDPDSKRIKV
jgi:4-methylaminobutanoate oxidase (formaldehyde-forming)